MHIVIEDVPNNIITGMFFDTYNINLRIAIEVILKVFKFYFKFLRFIESDKMRRRIVPTTITTPNQNTHLDNPESIPRNPLQNPLFTSQIEKFETAIVMNCKSFKEMHKYTFPTLFGNILKRLNKFQKYVKENKIKKEFQKMLCAIFQECISNRDSLNYSIYWEKMVYVFEKLGKSFNSN
jgi:hypothetical protein